MAVVGTAARRGRAGERGERVRHRAGHGRDVRGLSAGPLRQEDGAGGEMSGPWIAVVVALWVVVVLQGILQIGLLRRVLPILERRTRHDVGPPRLTGPPI